MKKAISNITPTKIGKQLGTTYCFGCKDYAKNFRPVKVKMTNKVLREKSLCKLEIQILLIKLVFNMIWLMENPKI